MAQWVIPIYAISGLLMAIGVYFTIRYRPYCTLKSPEKEEAMELHRKQILKEPMSEEEVGRNNIFQKNTKLFTIGMRILFVNILIHGIAIYKMSNQLVLFKEMYVLILIFVVPIYVGIYSVPFCFDWVFGLSKKTTMEYLLTYLEKNKGKILNEEKEKLYKHNEHHNVYFIVITYLLIFGASLILTLDILSIFVMLIK